MRFFALGKGLCVILAVVCCSIAGYAQLALNHGTVNQAFHSPNEAMDLVQGTFSDSEIKGHLRDSSIAHMAFNTEIEEIMLRARIQRKIILASV